MADYNADIAEHSEAPRHLRADDQTCMSSVTGFDFQLYPESGTMYPALASVPSDISNRNDIVPKMNDETAQPLPVLHEVAPSALEAPVALQDLKAPVTGNVAKGKTGEPTTATVDKLEKEQAMSRRQPNSKGTQNLQERSTSTMEKSDAPITGLNQQIFEQAVQDIQSMPSSPSPICQIGPGAHRVMGINANNEEREEDEYKEDTDEEDQQEEEVQVREAHLVDADDLVETASVSLSSALDFTVEEVLEAKALQSRESEQENRQGKLIVWLLMATIFVAALVLLLWFMLGRADDDQQQGHQLNTGTEFVATPGTTTTATTAPTTTIWYPPFLEDIPVEVIIGIETNVESPYYKANLWIWNDPNMDSYSPERLKQRFYLAMMYYATNGDGWLRKDNWLSYDVSECDWFSQSTYTPDSKYYEPDVCEDINGTSTVINLSLASNNLTGSWPIYYYDFLPLLRIIDLGNNHISGVMPSVTSSSYLEVFIISNNPLVGPFYFNADAFFDSIKVIRIDATQTEGNYGGLLFNIVSKGLEVFNSTGQPNDGQLWPILGTMTSLEYYGRGHMNTTGTISTEMGLMTSLKELDLSSSPFLSGSIPSELGLLTDLTLLDLTETFITGAVPVQLCNRVQAGLLEIPANCSSLQCCEGV